MVGGRGRLGRLRRNRRRLDRHRRILRCVRRLDRDRLRLGGGRRLGAVGQDFHDLDDRQILLVAALAARILAPPLLEGNHLGAARLLDDFADDARARDERRADLARLAVETLYCLPPVLMTANIVFSVFKTALRGVPARPAFLQLKDLLGSRSASPPEAAKQNAAESRAVSDVGV
jgi:hypothetical protein